MLASEILFWAGAAALLGTYIVYPLSMPLLARLLGRDHRTDDIRPAATLIISAYNEAEVIRAKLDNALALDYPADRLQVMVISDASDDATDDIVREYADRGVTLKRLEPRGGKSRGLTRFVPEANGEILIFSDANSMYDPRALRRLARHFADPHIGYVVGHQRYVAEDSAVSESEGTYWNIEIALKRSEGRLGSVVGGDGAIYAIRAELFAPLADEDISDFVNPLQIVARGYRGVFEPGAFCYEKAATSFEGEFRRKVRIVNRALRGLARVPAVLNPLRTGWFAYQILLHKVLRWFTPYFLAGALAGNLGVLYFGGGGLYIGALWIQAAFYALAALRLVPRIGQVKLVYLPYFFCLSSVAALLGTLSVLAGRQFVTWRPERG